MNYVYIVGSKEELTNKYFSLMAESVNKHCDCDTWVLEAASTGSPSRIIRKISGLFDMEFNQGDKIFVLEPTMIIQDNIFDVFDGSFDVAYTNKHYPSDMIVNSDAWAFVYNEKSVKFIEFLFDQIKDPTWAPLIKFRNKVQRLNTIHPWMDQDVFCAVYKNGHKINSPCRIKDIGYKYNFCPEVRNFNLNESIRQLKEQLGNKEYKILNFKGKTRILLDQKMGN